MVWRRMSWQSLHAGSIQGKRKQATSLTTCMCFTKFSDCVCFTKCWELSHTVAVAGDRAGCGGAAGGADPGAQDQEQPGAAWRARRRQVRGCGGHSVRHRERRPARRLSAAALFGAQDRHMSSTSVAQYLVLKQAIARLAALDQGVLSARGSPLNMAQLKGCAVADSWRQPVGDCPHGDRTAADPDFCFQELKPPKPFAGRPAGGNAGRGAADRGRQVAFRSNYLGG